ncbi:heme-binding protein [Flavobacteriales bacterium]|nr:heme-binding protein [Flavobacteriales bacterium]
METIEQSSISIRSCNEMFLKAEAEAIKQGIAISFHIVDTSGIVKFFSRMDGAPLISVDISRKKAITAVGFGMATGEPWCNFIKDDPILKDGVNTIKDFILLGGGMPIMKDGKLIGAIGISGGHYTQDEACCKKALE